MGELPETCRRCGETFTRELIFALLEDIGGASVSGERGMCWNSETEQMEEHDWWEQEEVDV